MKGKEEGRVVETAARVLTDASLPLGIRGQVRVDKLVRMSRTSSLTEPTLRDPIVPMIPVADQVVARIDTAGLLTNVTR